jgi:uncharacterized protein YfbU (UPF0304 family)
MKLSRTERLILSNQYRILQALYPAEKESLAAAREAVERGYELHYDRGAGHISEDVLTEEQCREVQDILRMFDLLQLCYGQVADKSGIEARRIRFRGFDTSDPVEGAYAAYARFFRGGRGGDVEGQVPLLGTYRKMLAAWRASKDETRLTRDDLVRITTF